MNDDSIKQQQKLFSDAYKQFGYSNKALHSSKGKQHIRFDNLLRDLELEKKSILDVGCGFGDLNEYLKRRHIQHYEYLGVDITLDFIDKAKELWKDYEQQISFSYGDFLKLKVANNSFDYVVGSEIFNLKLNNENNYENTEAFIEKAMRVCRVSTAFNFKSDKVDYQSLPNSFYSSPEKILQIAYKYSRNIQLRSDYMPFEFSIIINKDDGFDMNTTVFNKYLKENGNRLEKLKLHICKG